MKKQDISERLKSEVQEAGALDRQLNIVAGGSKGFLGRQSEAETLSVSKHCGIIDYEPRELVITARAGTPLKEIEQTLAGRSQMLSFEPPYFGEAATLGGTIACGLSGPRRPYVGAARDFVLGCKLLNGKGDIMKFGGQVMKNVAGYDVSRLMTGAYGTLGVMLELSLKVLPRPLATVSLYNECSQQQAITQMSGLLSKAQPVDGACYYKGQCYLRLSGSEQSIRAAQRSLPGEMLSKGSHFWQRLREHELSFFRSRKPLWRICVKPATPPLMIEGEWLLDWGGAQRWLRSDMDASAIRTVVKPHGGHVTLFRGGNRSGEVMQPLSPVMLQLQQRIKHSFDPHAIFNPGRLYVEI